jgi:hypothetical protein
VFVFDEEFGDLASFEDEDSDDASEGGEFGINQLVGYFEDDCVVNAGEEDPRWGLACLG